MTERPLLTAALRQFSDLVRSATAAGPVRIVGGDTKAFHGNPPAETLVTLNTGDYAGVMSYAPEELIIRARAGTRLSDVVGALAERGQHLPFEPPSFGPLSTIGGVVAAGISGSRRPYAGAVRDYVLGAGLIDANGTYQEFGGQVMKNVAGYDVSRLLAGSLGILGVIADVSLKVLPAPEREHSLRLQLPMADALQLFEDLRRQGAPLSAAAATRQEALVRLSGDGGHVERAVRRLEQTHDATTAENECWASIGNREFLERHDNLWRLSCPPTEPLGSVNGRPFDLLDWGGAQRWAKDVAGSPRPACSGKPGKGHWTLARSAQGSVEERFESLTPAIMKLHRNLKMAFDPAGKFNPDRMYRGL